MTLSDQNFWESLVGKSFLYRLILAAPAAAVPVYGCKHSQIYVDTFFWPLVKNMALTDVAYSERAQLSRALRKIQKLPKPLKQLLVSVGAVA